MAGSSLLALIDDIATLLDDIAVMSKTAAKKTAGVLGDDLALNAQQVTGIRAERELPVVWAVGIGSLKNKAILVPAALLISHFAPWAILPLLMIGGAYLCFEGVEKLAHKWLHKEEETQEDSLLTALQSPEIDMVAFEKEKITGAVRTDFILSAEIIVIALGTLPAGTPFAQVAMVLVAISIAMTLGVYGLVAGIVKLDDIGLFLRRKYTAGSMAHRLGSVLLSAAPILMKILSVAGTVAMFLVGGGILAHGIPPVHHAIEHWVSGSPALVQALVPALADLVLGLVAGAIVLIAVTLGSKLLRKS